MASPIVGTFMIRFSNRGVVDDTKDLLVLRTAIDGRQRTAHRRAWAIATLCDAIFFLFFFFYNQSTDLSLCLSSLHTRRPRDTATMYASQPLGVSLAPAAHPSPIAKTK